MKNRTIYILVALAVIAFFAIRQKKEVYQNKKMKPILAQVIQEQSSVSPQPPAINKGVIQKEKLRVDLKSLSNSRAFQAANPELKGKNISQLALEAKDIILPAGTTLSYQIDPKCRDMAGASVDESTFSAKARVNWEAGLPTFTEAQLKESKSVETLSTELVSNSCILAAIPSRPLLIGRYKDYSKYISDTRLADAAVRAALDKGETPKLNVIANGGELKKSFPWLFGAEEKTAQVKKLSYRFMDNSGSVPILARAQPLPPISKGKLSASDLSNAIVLAASRNATVINVYIAGFNSADFASAVSFANERGATVVSSLPVPPPSGLDRR